MSNAFSAVLLVCFMFISSLSTAQVYRSIDGTNNNLNAPNQGAARTEQIRWVDPLFDDGISAPNATNRANPRDVSNYIFDQRDDIANEMKLSDYLWVFGQFVDHDITLVLNSNKEKIGVDIPNNDEFFSVGSQMEIARALPMEGTGTDVDHPRSYMNQITSYIDGSGVYGSDIERANWLRTFKDGKLKVSEEGLLPWNTTTGMFNDPKSNQTPVMFDDLNSGTKLFVAGDVRANENPLLIGIHTIFLREHNRICDELKEKYPILSDEELYQRARKWVGAYIQSIVYNEWLPAMGVPITPYSGYKEDINATVSTEFSTTAFRFGHTLINSNMVRMGDDGNELPQGAMQLSHGYFNPTAIVLSQGIESFLVGMGTQEQQELDCKMIDDLRNFLFGTPDAGGIDLATVNIVRGREKGIPDFNSIRAQLGLSSIPSFNDLTRNTKEADRLKFIYGSINNMDPWVGMLAEHHMPGALFGNTILSMVRKQFEALRDGDRYYFENDDFFGEEDLNTIKSTKLYDIIMRNAEIKKMQHDLFFAMPHSDIPSGPDLLPLDFELAVYPNPTLGAFNLKVYSESDQRVTLNLYNIDAQLLLSSDMNLVKGDNFLQVDMLKDQPRGVYNLVVQSETAYNISKIVKEH